MVGFMEPVGTQFQSATADLKGKTKAATRASGLIHSFQRWIAVFFTEAFASIIRYQSKTPIENYKLWPFPRKPPGLPIMFLTRQQALPEARSPNTVQAT